MLRRLPQGQQRQLRLQAFHSLNRLPVLQYPAFRKALSTSKDISTGISLVHAMSGSVLSPLKPTRSALLAQCSLHQCLACLRVMLELAVSIPNLLQSE